VKLQELDRLKSRFFADISHEFRTPLTLILGPLLSLRQASSKTDIEKQCGIIERNALRLLRLINQLLDLSKLEAGKLRLQAAPGNLVPFVKGILYSFESLAQQENITPRFASAADEVALYFDSEKMEQILTNVLSNAFKFTPNGGKISVQLSVSSDQLSVTSNQLRHKQLITDH
ncbi:MAG: sensor histidine kinase, partial [bacterium]